MLEKINNALKKVNFRLLSIHLVFLILGIIAGYSFVFSKYISCNTKYHFLNQELGCEDKIFLDKKEYTKLKENIVGYLDQKVAEGVIIKSAVYFRDLQNGPTFGINEKERFIGASLLKLPVLITYLKLAEENPTILTAKLGYNGKETKEQVFKPKETVKPGDIYTVNELLERMIVYSDNASFYLLQSYLEQAFSKEKKLLETYQDLGIIYTTSDKDESLSVKTYAGIFRQLFNASYLSKGTSDMALELLTRTEFTTALRAGVPADIPVAHKFGERTVEYLPEKVIKKQFHDCGIVYYPNNPYLLCVMTKGDDYEKLVPIVKEISEMVYDEVKSREK